jgi:hypothetical protein
MAAGCRLGGLRDGDDGSGDDGSGGGGGDTDISPDFVAEARPVTGLHPNRRLPERTGRRPLRVAEHDRLLGQTLVGHANIGWDVSAKSNK